MSPRRMLAAVAAATALVTTTSAQTCGGPKTSIPSIGQVIGPPAASAPIDLLFDGTFKVPRTGVYHITGRVNVGRGNGSLAVFNSVKATIVGATVIDEQPPPIAPNPPNQWTYHWSIYYSYLVKTWEHRVYLVKDTPYAYRIEAKGYNQVVTQWHRRNYGIGMDGTATYCGPRAAATTVGTGCTTGATPPDLKAPQTPVIGQRRDLLVTGRANTQGLVAFGIPATTPLYIGAGCNVYLDLLLPYLALPVTTSASGMAFVVFSIPDDPSLSSLRIATQGVLANTGSPVGMDLTQGLVLTLGY